MGTFATTTSVAILMNDTEFDTSTTALVGKAIVRAETEIKKKLARRYDLSSDEFMVVAEVPSMVTSLCEELATGFSYRWMSRGSKESLARAKAIIDGVMANLNELAEGKVDLVDDDGNPIPQTDNRPKVQSNTTNYSPTFNEDNPLNWRADQDKLDDIADERD